MNGVWIGSKQVLPARRRNGRFTGFPVLGVKWQRMESAGLRASYGLHAPLRGVLIRSIWPTSPLAQAARPDDIIMTFDGTQVACDGTVPFRCRPFSPSCLSIHVPQTPCLLSCAPACQTNMWRVMMQVILKFPELCSPQHSCATPASCTLVSSVCMPAAHGRAEHWVSGQQLLSPSALCSRSCSR